MIIMTSYISKVDNRGITSTEEGCQEGNWKNINGVIITVGT
jgi:hypothetical protein